MVIVEGEGACPQVGRIPSIATDLERTSVSTAELTQNVSVEGEGACAQTLRFSSTDNDEIPPKPFRWRGRERIADSLYTPSAEIGRICLSTWHNEDSM